MLAVLDMLFTAVYGYLPNGVSLRNMLASNILYK